ncbi:conjugative transposon protein TraM [Dyadobacter chenwenxiniae]|uniref:Conjugative transposon protein TraM n=1 Tax=Dyadobacter chenwenxiniae TaxID=2906456 RepID=A0A9X1PH40_9BACT|nr:conjugative transposon protein TraM [Dyadobacter chenwenxiniae]MCF0059869.1 conjugative transposon protein TraM [Dyadobacter chenwenxiniae]UON85609.1 conjugative transposon protein TraM [Dyadobacter chenwenxiniae]
MQNKSYSRKFLQRRKFYTFLPLLVLPFLTMLFWVLIGRKQGDFAAEKDHKGLILSLPDAILKDDKSLNKLSFYQKASADSARLREMIKKDPYYQDTLLVAAGGPLGVPLKNLDGPGRKRKGLAQPNETQNHEQAEQQVHQKISELNRVLSQTSQPDFESFEIEKLSNKKAPSSAEIERLEQLMAGLDQEASEPESDPEMQELSGMIDKIMQIQNPDLAASNVAEQSIANRKQVFPVTEVRDQANVTLFGVADMYSDSATTSNPDRLSTNTGFYSLENSEPSAANLPAIEAVIDQDQTLVTGATVKFRLSTDVFIAGKRIPAGSFLYGKASLNQERLRVAIESVRSDNALFPVSLNVYDMDGIEGIYIPGAISRDVGKQSSDRAIQGINIPMVDPSIGAQAASAGIEAAKTFFGRKAKLIQVSVKAGYRVLLKDANAKTI